MIFTALYTLQKHDTSLRKWFTTCVSNSSYRNTQWSRWARTRGITIL